MNKSKYLGMSWQIIALSGAAAIGVIAVGFFTAEMNPQLIFIEMVKTLFHPFISGFILCAILAATMSTIDSQMLVCASVLSEDVYKKWLSPQASPQELLKVSRLCVLLVACVSLILAFLKNDTVLEAVRYAWSGLGCSFGPLVLFALYSKTVNRYGAIAGVIVGGALAGGWHFINPFLIDYTIPSEIPAFSLSALSIYAVSKLFASEEKKSMRQADK